MEIYWRLLISAKALGIEYPIWQHDWMLAKVRRFWISKSIPSLLDGWVKNKFIPIIYFIRVFINVKKVIFNLLCSAIQIWPISSNIFHRKFYKLFQYFRNGNLYHKDPDLFVMFINFKIYNILKYSYYLFKSFRLIQCKYLTLH